MYYLGVNFGRTSITAGVVNEKGEVILSGAVPTLKYRKYETILKDMADLCIKVVHSANLDIDRDIQCVGVGSSGTPDKKNGVLLYSSYFDFYNIPIRSELRKYIDLPIYLENDANCYALAESMLGSAKDHNNSVTVILGNAIGAGIIVNGKIYNGAFSGAGEVGHHVIVFEGEKCNCGRQGCWEAYASANSLVRDARIQAIRHPESEMFKMVNGDIRVMSANIPFEAAKTGDKWANEIVKLYIRYVSVGLINIINILQPDAIVLGGKMTVQGDYLLKPIADIVAKKTYGFDIKNNDNERKTKIYAAKLGYEAVIIGAAMIRQ